MDEAGVDRVVIVPPSWEGDRNDLAIAAVKAHPDRFAIMGRFNPEAPDARNRDQDLAQAARHAGHALFVSHPRAAGAADRTANIDWVWSEAEKPGIRLMILVPQSLVHLIDGVAARYPGSNRDGPHGAHQRQAGG